MKTKTMWTVEGGLVHGWFAFFPTIVYSWQGCPCMNLSVRWGNAFIMLSRQCVSVVEISVQTVDNSAPDEKEK